MTKADRVCLGAIAGVHGIKGEVKIKSFTENPRDVGSYGALENEDGTKKFDLKITGNSKELIRAKIKGIDDRNAAEALVSTRLYVNKDILPKLEEDEFYHADLIGLDVKIRENQEVIGKVECLYNFGAGDMIELKLDNSGKSEIIPFTKAYVPEVNIKNGYIIVESQSLKFQAEDKEDESDES